MSKRAFRVGQIVPSSNTTMETEVPAILQRYGESHGVNFTFHSSRMRMKKVTKEELAAMDRDSDRCALELSDARMDVMGYACLVAIMSMGHGYHRESERRLHQRTVENGGPAPVVTSAGALVEGLHALGAKRVAIIAPYMKPLTKLVIDYIEAEGVEVLDSISLEIEDNLAVGARDPLALLDIAPKLNIANADAVVLSACVQMPSLAAVPIVEKSLGVPVVSSAISTAFRMLEELELQTVVEGAGALLSGRYSSAAKTVAKAG
ncbi:Asp/Glu racemase [Sphingobium chlorophenolicum]|uniref:Maleate isomerase n=1 Tax=Sphingobium chlorophenolicum TaxID=46429 RepID=A0A081R9D5_SPHCR|nr:Asp/Glu racemase [Sphingobium chlorophenolicum]KEQ51808.1 Maleate isomerase [Sphingobium chlorophenolicum]